MAIIEALIEAIQSDGRSISRIADEGGLYRSQLTRLVKRERASLTVETAERVAEALGHEIRLVKRKGTQHGKRQ